MKETEKPSEVREAHRVPFRWSPTPPVRGKQERSARFPLWQSSLMSWGIWTISWSPRRAFYPARMSPEQYSLAASALGKKSKKAKRKKKAKSKPPGPDAATEASVLDAPHACASLCPLVAFPLSATQRGCAEIYSQQYFIQFVFGEDLICPRHCLRCWS